MKKRKVTATETKIQDLTHDTVPATVGLVKEIRDELRADNRSLVLKLDSVQSGLQALEHRLDSFQSTIQAVEHRLDSKIELVSSKLEKVMVSAHRTQVLMEEQRGENRIVLDGIKTLIDRQDRLETNVNELNNTFSLR